MDMVNTKIGQHVARESASTINDKSFAASNLIGFSSGVSQFARSELFNPAQQVKNAERSQVNLSEQQRSDNDKKLKASQQNADNTLREESLKLMASGDLSESLSKLSEKLQTNGTKISFTLDKSAQRPIVIVSDKDSGNVIRQIPSEEVLKFAEQIRELESGSSIPSGLVVDRQA